MLYSQYHDTCIPAHQRQQAQPQLEPHTKPLTVIDYTKCDEVQEDKMWKQSVHNEEKAVKQWQENWGFLTEYDDKVGSIIVPPRPIYRRPSVVQM